MGRNRLGTFGRPISEGNLPLDWFEEFCVRQYLRIKDGVERKHDYPHVPREVDVDEPAFMQPATDPEMYDVEVRR